MRKTQIILISSCIIAVVLVLAGISYYQSTHFNSQITINDTKVGGLTADKAIKKLESSVLKNKIYIGQKQILDEKDTNMGITEKDLPSVKKILKSQWTFLPSSKAKNYSLIPAKTDPYRSQTIINQINDKLVLMNKSLKAPKDAQAHLVQGKIIVSKSINGEQYDIARILEDYQKHEYGNEIHLKPVFIKPVKENSQIVKNEEKMLQELVKRTVAYKVQNQVYSLKGSDLIQNASVSKNMKYTIDTSNIKNKLDEINNSQSTLGKYFRFKTHSGSIISVKGQSYGWAIDVNTETKLIQKAFESGQKSVLANNIYGVGWSTYGIGYHNTASNGIGNTYAEVSIQEQRIWLYKNGNLILTTNVVTGRHNTHEDTPPGVWYIMYKQSPSVLQGSEVGNPNYSVKVKYWAPFTLGGVGFHDAPWRINWKSDAYLTQGSGGCVNTPPNVMKNVYNTLSQNEPVIVY